MTRDRFRASLKFLHFHNSDDPKYDPKSPDRDRLHKIRPFPELLRAWMQRVNQPGKCLSVDESLVLFKQCLTFKQYIKTKRSRFGIKKLYI